MKKAYSGLDKTKKNKVKEIYVKEYNHVIKRLNRLKIYALIGYLFAFLFLFYTFKFEDNHIGSIVTSVTLIVLATVYLGGSFVIKRRILNKIALEKK